MCGSDIFLACLAVLFPPLAVWVKSGICSADSLINLALCCLGFLPGLLHAWYIIYTHPDPYSQVPQDSEYGGATVTYYYVQQGQPGPRGSQRGYGTVNSQPGRQFPGQERGTVNAFAPPVKGGQTGNASQATAAQGSSSTGPSSRPDDVPPSYADALKGDNKIQSHD